MASYQLHGSLVLGSLLVSYWLAGSLTWRFAVLSVFCLLSMEFAMFLFFSWSERQLHRQRSEFEDRMKRLSYVDARAQALAALEGGSYGVEQRSASLEIQGLPPSLAEVFGRYSSVQSASGDLLQLGPVEGDFVEVGRTSDDERMVVRISDERLFEDAGEVHIGTDPPYPSIYHWLALNA